MTPLTGNTDFASFNFGALYDNQGNLITRIRSAKGGAAATEEVIRRTNLIVESCNLHDELVSALLKVYAHNSAQLEEFQLPRELMEIVDTALIKSGRLKQKLTK